MTPEELTSKVYQVQSESLTALQEALDVIGPDWDYISAESGRVEIQLGYENEGDLTALRRLRRVIGIPVSSQSVFPWKPNGGAGFVWFRFQRKGWNLDACLNVTDVSRFVRRGSNCQIVPQTYIMRCD